MDVGVAQAADGLHGPFGGSAERVAERVVERVVEREMGALAAWFPNGIDESPLGAAAGG